MLVLVLFGMDARDKQRETEKETETATKELKDKKLFVLLYSMFADIEISLLFFVLFCFVFCFLLFCFVLFCFVLFLCLFVVCFKLLQCYLVHLLVELCQSFTLRFSFQPLRNMQTAYVVACGTHHLCLVILTGWKSL